MNMETFVGYIKTPQDALIIFEACRRGILNRVQRRLTSKERMNIRSGSIFAWDEREAGMRRWTDGRTWSPSRVLGSFLTYKELDTKRRPRRQPSISSTSDSNKQLNFSYKLNGLIKQSFSICTTANQKIHLISYYTKQDILSGRLQRPSQDHRLKSIVIPKGLYPELNPLDIGGGHIASMHSIRQEYQYFSQLQQQQQQRHDSIDSSYSQMTLSSSSTSSSCSSSSSSRSEQLLLTTPPLSTNQTSPASMSSVGHLLSPLPLPTTPTTPSSYYQSELLPSPILHKKDFKPAASKNTFPPMIQDIAWERLPCSEDNRQLNALREQVRV